MDIYPAVLGPHEVSPFLMQLRGGAAARESSFYAHVAAVGLPISWYGGPLIKVGVDGGYGCANACASTIYLPGKPKVAR